MNSTGVEITAGLGGFLVLFFLAVALILLGLDLNRRLRRLDRQEQLRLTEERLMREREASQGSAVGPESEDSNGSAADNCEPQDEKDADDG